MTTKKSHLTNFLSFVIPLLAMVGYWLIASKLMVIQSALELRILFSRSILVGIIAALLTLLVIEYPRVRRHLMDWFNATDFALNLAVARIVVFLTFAQIISADGIAAMASLPESFRTLTPGLEWFSQIFLIDPIWSPRIVILFQIACISAALGLFTRTSALIATLLGVYVLGIPQIFGKIGHYHHILWFASLLSFSRSGDALSVDAWFNRKKKNSALNIPSREYAAPLRWIWVLIGVLYFFPGFWKWAICGVDWFTSDNLRRILIGKWREFGDWTPFIRIDTFPLLYKFSALSVLVFELSFLPMLFFARTRLPIVLSGLAFHQVTRFFMRISFWTLEICYFTFFNWQKLFSRFNSAFVVDIPPKPETLKSPINIHLLGAALTLIAIWCGFNRINSWPFTTYPDFAFMAGSEDYELEIQIKNGDGTIRMLESSAMQVPFDTATWKNRIGNVVNLKDTGKQSKQLIDILEIAKLQDSTIAGAQQIRFIKITLELGEVYPPLKEKSRTLLYELNIKSSGQK